MTIPPHRVQPDTVRALYDPKLGQVACVLIQAALGGDRRACLAFDARDWFTAPTKDMVMVSAPIEQWREVAAMSREERMLLPMARKASSLPHSVEEPE